LWQLPPPAPSFFFFRPRYYPPPATWYIVFRAACAVYPRLPDAAQIPVWQLAGSPWTTTPPAPPRACQQQLPAATTPSCTAWHSPRAVPRARTAACVLKLFIACLVLLVVVVVAVVVLVVVVHHTAAPYRALPRPPPCRALQASKQACQGKQAGRQAAG